jgi:hypothetical protein
LSPTRDELWLAERVAEESQDDLCYS